MVNGKTVMITGASRGIGAAAAEAFAAAGANVALVARSGDEIGALANKIGPAALALPCDVADFDAVQGAVDACVARFGALDVLINNAGVIDPIGAIETADPNAWGKQIDINLKGVFHGLRAALPGMLERGGGTILNVSSGAAYGPTLGWAGYNASKAGALMLTRSVHLELGERSIRSLGLSPGTVATDMQRAIKASGINRVSQLDWSDHIPPEWPARALIWLCGPEADEYLGGDISLREPEIRAKIGLS